MIPEGSMIPDPEYYSSEYTPREEYTSSYNK
jgi:hypothetical protein